MQSVFVSHFLKVIYTLLSFRHMENEENGEVIVDDAEDSNDEVTETIEEPVKQEKPKRTPQEEYEYHMGRAKRLAKKHGIEVKAEKSEPKSNSSTPSSKPNDLDYGQLALLNSYVGLKGKDEIALAREYIANGKDILGLSENKFFIQDLQTLRETKESANAIPKGKNRSGQTAVTDVDLAVAKYKETGELPSDFETRNKVVDALTAEEKGSMFNFK